MVILLIIILTKIRLDRKEGLCGIPRFKTKKEFKINGGIALICDPPCKLKGKVENRGMVFDCVENWNQKYIMR